MSEAVTMEEPHLNLFFSAKNHKNKFYTFAMASKQKKSGNRKRVNLSIGEKLELIKKLELGALVVRVSDDYGVKK